MKKLLKALPLIAAPVFCMNALDAATATTDPVGGSTVSIASGNVPVSCGYVHPNSYVGAMSSVAEAAGNSTITVSGATFTPSAWDKEATGGQFAKYYVEITESGHAFEGANFDIVSNTGTTIVVEGLLATNYSIAGTESFAVRKHMTIADFFANATLGAWTDSVKFFESNGSTVVYLWLGAQWSSDFGTTDHSNRPIYPGQGFIATMTAPRSFTATGNVKTTRTMVPVYNTAGVINMVAAPTPVDSTLGAQNFASQLSDWTDSVKTFQAGGLSTDKVYLDTGAYMSSDFGTTNEDSATVSANSAILVTVGSNKNITLPAAF